MRWIFTLVLLLLLSTAVDAALLRGFVTETRDASFVVEGRQYDVSAVAIGDGAILRLNGVETGVLREDDWARVGEARIRIQEVLASDAGGLVEFYLSVPGVQAVRNRPSDIYLLSDVPDLPTPLPVMLARKEGDTTRLLGPGMLFHVNGRRLLVYTLHR